MVVSRAVSYYNFLGKYVLLHGSTITSGLTLQERNSYEEKNTDR